MKEKFGDSINKLILEELSERYVIHKDLSTFHIVNPCFLEDDLNLTGEVNFDKDLNDFI
jgi:hypothetical protein